VRPNQSEHHRLQQQPAGHACEIVLAQKCTVHPDDEGLQEMIMAGDKLAQHCLDDAATQLGQCGALAYLRELFGELARDGPVRALCAQRLQPGAYTRQFFGLM
jgi:hypothetical protein